MILVNSLVCGLAVTVINTIINYEKLGELFKTNLYNAIMITAITFLCATIIAFIVFGLIYLANKKRQEEIDAKLNDDEDINR